MRIRIVSLLQTISLQQNTFKYMKGLSLTISKELASLKSILFQKGQTLNIGLLISDEMNNIKIQTIKKKIINEKSRRGDTGVLVSQSNFLKKFPLYFFYPPPPSISHIPTFLPP